MSQPDPPEKLDLWDKIILGCLALIIVLFTWLFYTLITLPFAQ